MRVSRLRPHEAVTLDTETLDEMCARLGFGKAEIAICSAMEDLAVLLQYAETLLRAGETVTLEVTSRQIAGIAERIGMVRLENVAKSVCVLCRRDDSPALSANVERMRRVGEQSLIAIWDREDLSI